MKRYANDEPYLFIQINSSDLHRQSFGDVITVFIGDENCYYYYALYLHVVLKIALHFPF